ncbi:34100_t:CDS:2 [Gigaspora margarita]|uniref:34100_t:CDS:1 n=1 Tax=Gigaspora margarita TaxID=4874 RepID=A0ABN7UC31_GIGMA|nr:34100_t:CDS:2 [Gigaspora margarita]
MADESATRDESVAVTTAETVEDNSEVAVTTKEEKNLEETGYKVFVGNLAFSTNEDQLAEFFNKTANIITRGTRSLGYGFVALETEEDANKVVEELNKKELDGRQINVEVAKPKENTAPTSNPGQSYRGGSRRRRFNRSTGDDGGANADANDSTAVVPSDAPTANGTSDHKGRGGTGTAKTGEPSKTIIFVANLPFSINDDGLKDIFKDYNVTSAHVVRRRHGRSKGFGFVTFSDEEEQKKALEGLKTVTSEGRELVIKVALSDQHIQSDDAEKTEAPAVSSDEKKETDA